MPWSGGMSDMLGGPPMVPLVDDLLALPSSPLSMELPDFPATIGVQPTIANTVVMPATSPIRVAIALHLMAPQYLQVLTPTNTRSMPPNASKRRHSKRRRPGPPITVRPVSQAISPEPSLTQGPAATLQENELLSLAAALGWYYPSAETPCTSRQADLLAAKSSSLRNLPSRNAQTTRGLDQCWR